MWTHLVLAVIPVLGIIGYEDFKSRQISVIWPATLLALSIMITIQNSEPAEVFKRVFMNSAISSLILLSGTLLVKLRKPGISRGEMIGTGDFLFLVSISPLFRFELFLVFLNFSFLLVLVSSVLYNLIGNKKLHSIPLAGGLSILTLLWLIIELSWEIDFLSTFNPYLVPAQ